MLSVFDEVTGSEFKIYLIAVIVGYKDFGALLSRSTKTTVIDITRVCHHSSHRHTE